MKTPEEIKKGLQRCSGENLYTCSAECPYDSASGIAVNCISNMAADALAYIRQLEHSYDVHRQIIEELNLYIAAWGVHQHEWVSVKDRQPCVEECRYLVCLDDGFIATAIWDNGWELWADAGEVTHWMPLPEPPKED